MAYRKTRKLNKLRKRKKRLYCKTKRKSLRGGGWFSTKRIPFRLTGDVDRVYMGRFNFDINDDSYIKMICLSPAIDDITEGKIDKPESKYITGLVYGDMDDIRSKLLDVSHDMYNKQYTNDEFMKNYQIPNIVKNILKGRRIIYIKIDTDDYNIYEKISQQ